MNKKWVASAFMLVLCFRLYAGPNEDLYKAAAVDSNIENVKAALAAGADVNSRNPEDGYTPLIGASTAQADTIEIVKLLIKAKAQINAKSKDGQTAMFVAAFLNKKEIVGFLISAGADLNLGEKSHLTPLMVAASQGFTEVAALLIASKANVNAKGKLGLNALFNASGNGHTEIVKYLIEAKADVNSKTQEGFSPLAIAAKNGHGDAAQLLIEARAHVDTVDKNGFSPLMHAATNGHIDVAKLLIQARANLQLKDKHFGLTALQMVIAQNSDGSKMELVEILRAPWKATPERVQASADLIKAAEAGNVAGLQAAMNSGAYLNAENEYGHTALGVAAQKGHSEIVKVLIAAKANVNKNADSTANIGKYTPLMEAVAGGHIDTVKLLLKAGAKVNEQQYGTSGDSALLMAVQHRHKELVKILIKKGARVNAHITNQHTILMYADEPEIKEMLEAAGAR